MDADRSSFQAAGPSTSAVSRPSPSSLFNADEVQFMQDSFSSAETFDPFTIGAPGFKVPNTLPANLGGIGAAPNTTTIGTSNAMSTSLTPTAEEIKANLIRAAAAAKGGYGQDKAWQTEQLQALQAERFKYMSMQNALPPSQRSIRMANKQQQMQFHKQLQQQQFQQQQQAPHDQQQHSFSILGGNQQLLRAPAVLPDTSQIGHSLASLSSWPPNDGQQMLMMPSMNGNMAGPSSSATMGIHPSTELSSLGAHFPSSHRFPSHGGMAGGNGDFLGMYAQDGMTDQDSYQQQQQQTLPTSSSKSQAPSSARGTSRKSGTSTGKSAQKTAIKSSPDPDSSYTFQSAPRPPLPSVNLDRIADSNIIPAHLHEAFFAPHLPRLQPHLTILRQEQERRKAQGLSANIRKDRRDAKQYNRTADGDDSGNASEDGGAAGASAKSKKQAHALLTEAEKKANHIASEQKRRANIRKGYEALCALVPTLKEEMSGGDSGGKGASDEEGEDEDEDDEEGDDDAETAADEGGNRKRGRKRRAGGEDSAMGAGKTGPRSEAMLLMKAVEYMRTQVEHHHHLVVRKQELQRQLAQRFGAGPDCFTLP